MKAIVMAAGKGTRLAVDGVMLPKVLREANGRPLLDYVLGETLGFMDKKDIVVVTGYMAEKVEERFKDCGVVFAKQGDAAYGTGYAVMCGLEGGGLDDYHGDIVILNGDAPLIRQSTVKAMIDQHLANKNDCTLLSLIAKHHFAYGRLIRDENGVLVDIKEEKECNEEEFKINELNAGGYVFNADKLREGLKQIDSNNAAGEYYLTSVPPVMLRKGEKVEAYKIYDEEETQGVNTHEDLLNVEAILNKRK